jgi:biotin carboxylase
VLTADNKPGNPGHALADASFNCDTTDIPALVTLAHEYRINGVLAAATDVALEAAAAIAAALDLAGPSIDCARILTRKLAFRTFQARLGLPGPRFAECTEKVDFKLPWIVKPNRASGSKGIRAVQRREDLAAAWVSAAAQSIDGLAMAESFDSGAQGTIEGVMADGQLAAWLITDRLTASFPWVATRGHRVPTTLPETATADLLAQIQRVFVELHYADGPFDGDFVIRDDGTPMLIELAPRAGGNSLVRLLHAATGFDMATYAVDAALRRATPPARFEPRPAATDILGVERAGRLTYDVEQVGQLANSPGIGYLHLDVPPGASVQAFIDGRYRVGELTASAETSQALQRILADAHRRIHLRVH